ncbi:hypothetical protein BS78_07G196000 [Paspalum vaginatum]|nr:hypothetical protein BS78_07G196000 [Paspalum vaginatum]
MDSASTAVEFKVNYEQAMRTLTSPTFRERLSSEAISAGGHTWTISFQYFSSIEKIAVFLRPMTSMPSIANAIFHALLDAQTGMLDATMTMQLPPMGAAALWKLDDFAGGSENLVKRWAKDGHLRFLCTITVLKYTSAAAIPAPPSDICKHLGALLDAEDGSDVSFTIDGETFRAHRAVLAARSPVFRAELLGSMAESKMPSIAIQDIAPATFKAVLQYMYTDALPRDDDDEELVGGSSQEMFERLLAAADRYALDRLKLLCAQKLWDNVSVDTVASVLGCAEMYSCPELKSKCIGFFAQEKNFTKAVLTEGFVRLVQQFPSIVFELREKCETIRHTHI